MVWTFIHLTRKGSTRNISTRICRLGSSFKARKLLNSLQPFYLTPAGCNRLPNIISTWWKTYLITMASLLQCHCKMRWLAHWVPSFSQAEAAKATSNWNNFRYVHYCKPLPERRGRQAPLETATTVLHALIIRCGNGNTKAASQTPTCPSLDA